MRICSSMFGLVAAGVLLAGASAQAAVVLNSSSGPESTYGSTVNFTTEANSGWVYYGGAPRGPVSYEGNERNGMNVFSPLTVAGSTVGVVLSGGAGYFCNIVYTDGTTPTNNGTGSANNTYARYGVAGDGLAFSYTLAGNTAAIIKVYAENYNALAKMTLVSAASGQLYADADPVGLPAPDAAPGAGAGSGHGAGVYTFSVVNTSSNADTLTFTYLMTGINGASGVVGLQGATVSVVPEAATVGVLGLGVIGLFSRRRRI